MASIIENRQAKYNYFIEDTLECGIQLRGNEVKSIAQGKCSIKEAWVAVENGELIAKGMHVTKWDTANLYDVDERRERKLLAHKQEITKLQQQVTRDGYTLVPLKVYFNNGKCKMLVGVCKGKHNYDKRETAKRNTAKREAERAMKSY